MGFGSRAPQRGRGEQRAALRGPHRSRTLKRPSRRDASGQHRQRKEERRRSRELLEARTGRGACAAGPPAVAGASLGIPPERPPLEEFERSEHQITWRRAYTGFGWFPSSWSNLRLGFHHRSLFPPPAPPDRAQPAIAAILEPPENGC